MSFDLRVISLGAGVQSSTMYLMAANGEFDAIPDMAVFADTQQEPYWVYENLDALEDLFGFLIPIGRPTAGDLGQSIKNATDQNRKGKRFAAIPFWVQGDKKPVPGRRQCTREYKIDVVKKAIREKLGLRPRQRAAGKFLVEEWVGISVDEAHRAKPSRYPWLKTRWPLLEKGFSREDCIEWLQTHNYPIPRKSACVFCPYRSSDEWLRWKNEEPDLFERACQWDELLRRAGPLRGMQREQFISQQAKPLREITQEKDPIDHFGNECEGMCGV